jgi:hypothetical protein
MGHGRSFRSSDRLGAPAVRPEAATCSSLTQSRAAPPIPNWSRDSPTAGTTGSLTAAHSAASTGAETSVGHSRPALRTRLVRVVTSAAAGRVHEAQFPHCIRTQGGMTRHSPFHSPEAATPVGMGGCGVLHQVFKTGYGRAAPGWEGSIPSPRRNVAVADEPAIGRADVRSVPSRAGALASSREGKREAR